MEISHVYPVKNAHSTANRRPLNTLRKPYGRTGQFAPIAGRLETQPSWAGKARSPYGRLEMQRKGVPQAVYGQGGTVFEHGRIPLNKMLQAVYLLCCSKKGCSSHQLHRILGITYKSAWFLSHRIREAMRTGSLAPMGGDGGIVEVDETYIGRQARLGRWTPAATTTRTWS